MSPREERLKEIVLSLLDEKKEGDFWDFKEKFGSNVSIVHDIICFANIISHEGDRYLIYGINDNFEITGIDESERKHQADIIDLLRNAHFASIQPDIYLDTITIEDKTIQVITVKDTKNKPYFITINYQKNKETLYAGAIYTRIGDTNTPKNMTASFYDTELIWKQHFGIDLTGIERIKLLLKNPDDWEKVEDESGTSIYHKYYPEYRIIYSDSEERDGEAYICSYPDTSFHYFELDIYFHQTRLLKIPCVHCDGFRISIPDPDIDAIDGKPLYFYKRDTIKYLILKMMCPFEDYLYTNIFGIPNKYIMLFENDDEYKSYYIFLESRVDKFDLIERYNPFNDKKCKYFQERVNFLRKCLYIYSEWEQSVFSEL